ncbi:hypothetical protein T11_10394 [Trichinella zimbabwensis]|uniref:Uncharacterized protein n=1 Tax=Trichinella zimbabwensis TaxID=268475 RepID=A0A0V1GYI1_9BILA|nr:hypothetical protein T11_10394 [Trichinella zimbabwensis]
MPHCVFASIDDTFANKQFCRVMVFLKGITIEQWCISEMRGWVNVDQLLLLLLNLLIMMLAFESPPFVKHVEVT